MDTIKYVCIDNETDSTVRGLLSRIAEAHPDLQINLLVPEPYERQVDVLSQQLTENSISGIILDLRLDDMSRIVSYRGPTVAQELRTRSTEKINTEGIITPACPLVLWSTDPKLEDSYRRDDTSHDLFDYKIFKDKLADSEGIGKKYASEVAQKLVSLVKGYCAIQQFEGTGPERAASLLQVDYEWAKRLDERIFAPLWEGNDEMPVHEQARYIRTELLETPNYGLITSAVAAARLGIDIKQLDSERFKIILNQLFPEVQYKGPFHEGWISWWVSRITEGWAALPNNPGSLLRLTAEQRVAFLNNHLETVELKPASQLEYTTSSKFSTICRITGLPLDPTDGFATARNLQPWQLTEYVSLFGMKNKDTKQQKHIKIDPLEQQRFHEQELMYLGNKQI